jgi:predicted dienelactone hydrolase
MTANFWRAAMAVLASTCVAACGNTTTADSADAATADAVGDVAADVTTTRADLTWPPNLPGPYNVGYRNVALTYVPASDGVTRTIQLNVWYPTTDATGTPAVYFAGLPIPHDDVFQDAKLAPPVDAAGYPLHLFSHGHLGYGGSAPYMVRHFATHGWVVIAPDHTGNTTIDNSAPRPPGIYWWRETDDVACLDWLDKLPAGDPLYQKVRTERTFLSGHSFGSMDTWGLAGAPYDAAMIAANCAAGVTEIDCSDVAMAKYKAGFRDKRVIAAAQLAGGVGEGVFAADAPSHVQVPILMMTGTADTGHPSAPLWDPLLHGIWIEITGACHQTFGLGDCEAPMTAQVGPPIVWTYTLAFARAQVLGDTGAQVAGIMDGTTQVSPLAAFHIK